MDNYDKIGSLCARPESHLPAWDLCGRWGWQRRTSAWEWSADWGWARWADQGCTTNRTRLTPQLKKITVQHSRPDRTNSALAQHKVDFVSHVVLYCPPLVICRYYVTGSFLRLKFYRLWITTGVAGGERLHVIFTGMSTRRPPGPCCVFRDAKRLTISELSTAKLRDWRAEQRQIEQ